MVAVYFPTVTLQLPVKADVENVVHCSDRHYSRCDENIHFLPSINLSFFTAFCSNANAIPPRAPDTRQTDAEEYIHVDNSSSTAPVLSVNASHSVADNGVRPAQQALAPSNSTVLDPAAAPAAANIDRRANPLDPLDAGAAAAALAGTSTPDVFVGTFQLVRMKAPAGGLPGLPLPGLGALIPGANEAQASQKLAITK